MDIEGGGQDASKDLRNWESKPLLDPRYWHSCSMIWGLTEERVSKVDGYKSFNLMTTKE